MSRRKRKRPEIYCCEGCGRDTTNRSRICPLCGGSAERYWEDPDEEWEPEGRDHEIEHEVEDVLRDLTGDD